MEYSYAQYQADRKLLRFRDGIALPVPATLPLKLDKAMKLADPADHPAIEAAFNRLLAMAETGPETIPLPPRRVKPTPPRPAALILPATPPMPVDAVAEVTAKAESTAREADRVARAAWQEALQAQAVRHKRRRAAWGQLAPPFREPPPQVG